MMSAVQPFISGAISKTVNLPESATVEDIADAYTQGWKLGLKALAIYRDGSKTAQALRTDAGEKKAEPAEAARPSRRAAQPVRRRMPRERESITHKFSIAGHEGYITAGKYEDGSVGEIFLTDIGKEGSTLRGMMNAFATAISIGLQYGVPLEVFVRKFSYMRFDPEGITNNPEIPFAKSMPDYLMRWLGEPLHRRPRRARGPRHPDRRGPGPPRGPAEPAARRRRRDRGQRRQRGQRPRQRLTTRATAPRPSPVPPTAALTDTPPVIPAQLAGPRPRPGLRAVRRHDAAHRLLLHLLELREQHRLRVDSSGSSEAAAGVKAAGAARALRAGPPTYAPGDELTTDQEVSDMPMIELTYPKGAIASDAREELLEELATKMLAAERAPDTEFFRSITWVYANEIEPETLAVGGRPGGEPRFRVQVTVPEGALSDRRKGILVDSFNQAVLRRRRARRERGHPGLDRDPRGPGRQLGRRRPAGPLPAAGRGGRRRAREGRRARLGYAGPQSVGVP